MMISSWCGGEKTGEGEVSSRKCSKERTPWLEMKAGGVQLGKPGLSCSSGTASLTSILE
jgi:hypothetical protein